MSVPIRDGATVAMLRDAANGVEVFMLKRSSTLVFSPRAHVFPGGAVDAADHDDAHAAWCALLDPAPPIPVAFFIAALREAFEEAGLLLARDAAGTLVRLNDPETVERFALHRKAIHTGDASIGEVCAAEGLVLAIDELVLFGHWVTPSGAPRRYDTRFFAARAPDHQDASPDGYETTLGLWIRPVDMLAANDAGEVELILPTRRTLEQLARFGSVEQALTGLARRR